MWEPIISEQDLEIRRGDVVRVKIREIKLPPNTIVVPIGYGMNAYGSVVDVVQLGRFSRIEEEKKITQAIFLALEDSKIEKDDLLGVISVYFVGLDQVKPLLELREQKEFTMVYRSGGGIIKKRLKIDPFGFKRQPIGKWELLITNEDKKVEIGKPCLVAVKKLKLPKNTLIYPMSIMRNPYGVLVDTMLEKLSRVEEEKVISHVVFLPILNGEIKKGDIVGIINIYDVEVGMVSAIKSWLHEWLETIQQVPD